VPRPKALDLTSQALQFGRRPAAFHSQSYVEVRPQAAWRLAISISLPSALKWPRPSCLSTSGVRKLHAWQARASGVIGDQTIGDKGQRF
jgi:hypothetical protein